MPATDNFSRFQTTDISPLTKAVLVTPSDSTDLAFVTRAIYVGEGGAVTVNMADSGTAITFANVPTGTTLPIRVSRIRATLTVATDIIALA
jgi:hypothetical protein